MAIKDEIKALIQTLEDQLKNFDKVPDERLEAFLCLCRDTAENYSDEVISTRELQITLLCLEADVRNPNNIGHCGDTTDYVWEDGKWVTGEEQDSDDEEEEEDDED